MPSHTGNDQPQGQGVTNTANPDGAPSTAGNTTTTPIPDGPSKDDLAYLALKGKEAEKAASDLGFGNKIPAPKVPFNSHIEKNDIPNSVKKEFGLPGKWR
ncbi:hypothetical protein ABC733_27720 [Mangrovibacter sp. SLW1]